MQKPAFSTIELMVTIIVIMIIMASLIPSTTKFCCWSGTTSTECNSNNGSYSGCTRTVCDWRAANEYCSKLTYLGKFWRLPTSNEWASIGTKLSNISIEKGTEGIMLCDHRSGYSSARCNGAVLGLLRWLLAREPCVEQRCV